MELVAFRDPAVSSSRLGSPTMASFPLFVSGDFCKTDHLGFWHLGLFPLDDSLVHYLCQKFTEDGMQSGTKITYFQLEEGVDPQRVHFIHGHIVGCLSRRDPLQLRFVHTDQHGHTRFVYVPSSCARGKLLSCNPRVVLAFVGPKPDCYVCGSSLCKSIQWSEEFVKQLLTMKKGYAPKIVRRKLAKLSDTYQTNSEEEIPGCVSWMMEHLAKNYPKI